MRLKLSGISSQIEVIFIEMFSNNKTLRAVAGLRLKAGHILVHMQARNSVVMFGTGLWYLISKGRLTFFLQILCSQQYKLLNVGKFGASLWHFKRKITMLHLFCFTKRAIYIT